VKILVQVLSQIVPCELENIIENSANLNAQHRPHHISLGMVLVKLVLIILCRKRLTKESYSVKDLVMIPQNTIMKIPKPVKLDASLHIS